MCNRISASQKTGAYLSVKGVRDIASGLFVFILMAAGATHLLGWVILAATIIPLADVTIVLSTAAPKSIAWGVHGVTAVVMLVTSALLPSLRFEYCACGDFARYLVVRNIRISELSAFHRRTIGTWRAG